MRPRIQLGRRLRVTRQRTLWRLRGAPPAADGALDAAMLPIFVGGTGRSGTTILSALLGRHPELTRLISELRFITEYGGLVDVVEGSTSVGQFGRRINRLWWERGDERHKGLKLFMERSELDAALAELRERHRRDPYGAANAFIHRLFDPLAHREGARGWIEMTPSSALRAKTLARMFPGLRLVHAVRDGRDVACSVVRMPWGPKDALTGLEWWARRVEQGFLAGAALPPEQHHVVQLERFVVHDREGEYRRLLDFIGLEDHPEMRGFFENRMTADGMHAGRWRTEVPAGDRAAFERRYAEIEARFRRAGYPYEPADEALAATG